jgi:hypothetical protein
MSRNSRSQSMSAQKAKPQFISKNMDDKHISAEMHRQKAKHSVHAEKAPENSSEAAQGRTQI